MTALPDMHIPEVTMSYSPHMEIKALGLEREYFDPERQLSEAAEDDLRYAAHRMRQLDADMEHQTKMMLEYLNDGE